MVILHLRSLQLKIENSLIIEVKFLATQMFSRYVDSNLNAAKHTVLKRSRRTRQNVSRVNALDKYGMPFSVIKRALSLDRPTDRLIKLRVQGPLCTRPKEA